MRERSRSWPSISPFRQWGPLILVLALLTAGTAVASIKGSNANSGKTTTASEGDAHSFANNPRLPVTYADAKKAGTTGDYDWGNRCDTNKGRIMLPSVYAPPCVPVWNGTKPWKDRGGKTVTSNGGATAPGVTDKTITVVWYINSPKDLFTTFTTLGVFDSASATYKLVQDLVRENNNAYELYGRKVVLKAFHASGDGKAPGPARADAIAVATQLHAFASIGGPTQTSAYQDELAQRGVLCIACGYSVPDSDFQKDAPYAWSTLPIADQLVYGVFDFGVTNLWGHKAQFAGDPTMRDKKRVFGVVHYEQDPPVFNKLANEAIAYYKSRGYSTQAPLTYLLDQDTLPQQAQTIIDKLKAQGVTSVVFLGDPLMLLTLTGVATKQSYFPEWLITGTVFTDSTAAGRLMDKQQWKHAFGASSQPARTIPQQSEPWRLYKWYFGKDPKARKSLPVVSPQVTELFLGLDLAGPDLTARTFAGGLFRYPPSGGGPTVPRISFGFHGVSHGKNADYAAYDDFSVVWWDPNLFGPNEQNTFGNGMWRYVQGGKRLVLGQVPKESESQLFNPTNSPGILPSVPKSDQTPNYPPPPGSPAAGGH